MDKKYGFADANAAEFPPIVIVNMTNVCNLSCVHCPHRVIKKRPDYKPAFMSGEIFEAICRECSQNKITVMRLASDGECLIHPRFFELMDIAKKYGVYPINLTTNGLLMDEKACAKILDSGINVVDVSIDALSDETYKKIRVGGDLKKVRDNVLKLIEMRNRGKYPVKIFVSFVKQELNAAEAEEFQKFWGPKLDFVLMRNYCNLVGLVEDKGIDEKKPSHERWPCPQFWKRVTVDFHGNIHYCVEDWLNKTTVANIKDRTIKDVWKGAEYRAMREKHHTGRFGELALCGECTDWMASPWDLGYEKIINAKVHDTNNEPPARRPK